MSRQVLVTGASKGIGKAIAIQLAKDGFEIAVHYMGDKQGAEDTLKSITELGGAGRLIQFDISNRSACRETLESDIAEHGAYYGVVNNAGINRVGSMEEQSTENIDAVIDLNIRTLYKISQAAITPMKRAESASIVNMSSQMGFVGSPNRTLYCMSKHAVEGVTKAMAVELAEHNIRVNTVAPTFVLTPMTKPMFEDESFKQFVYGMIPLGRLGKVEDVANSCTFLLSDLASMITGTSIKVDGGWTAR